MRKAIVLCIMTFTLILIGEKMVSCKEASIIQGTIKDGEGLQIPKALVVLVNGSSKQISHSDEFGNYDFQVLSGVYSLKVTAPGFCSSLRPPLSVLEEESLRFDFVMVPCSASSGSIFARDGSSAFDKTETPYVEEIIEIATNPKSHSSVLLRYGVFNQAENTYLGFHTKTIYDSGSKLENVVMGKQPVTLMFDRLTVTAESIFFDRKQNTFFATGTVKWSVGSRFKEVRGLKVTFSDFGYTLCENY